MASGDMLETIEVDTNMANMNNSKELATYREIGDVAEIEGNLLISKDHMVSIYLEGNTFLHSLFLMIHFQNHLHSIFVYSCCLVHVKQCLQF